MVHSFESDRKVRQVVIQDALSFALYVVAKLYADYWLRKSNLDHTIIHPCRLTNDEATGKINADETVDRDEIPREDVAGAILACLENDSTVNKEFQVISGENEINKAIQSL